MSASTEQNFADHYYAWRAARLRSIIERYGADSFRGIRVLEIGCGYGDIGIALRNLGAEVVFAEGRAEHLQTLNNRYPFLEAHNLVQYDAEQPWPFKERDFDIVLNLGLVYHVDNWERSIAGSISSAEHVILETEVCDSSDPDMVVKTQESGYDQALSGTGSRPSGPAIERLIRSTGAKCERVNDSRCNAGFHRYDWPIEETGRIDNGLRRFWFIWR